MTELSNYVATLPVGQGPLCADRFTSKKWNRVGERANMPKLKFHDLRKTFASLLVQRGVSTAVTQRLLEHSTPQFTNEIYANVDPALRQAVVCLLRSGCEKHWSVSLRLNGARVLLHAARGSNLGPAD